MAPQSRGRTLCSILKGVALSLVVTLVFMAGLALLVVRFGLSDNALTALNQLTKVTAIFMGVWASVGRGGQRGFALGAATGLIYMVLSYGIYCLLDGQMVPAGVLAGEFAMGAGLGALSGALVANLRPAKGKKRRAARAA